MEASFTRMTVLVSNMDRSVRFYKDILGLRPRTVSDEWSEFSLGGASLALHPGRQAGPANLENGTDASTVHIAFAVSDIERACEELRTKGVVVDGPRVLGDLPPMATFSDPDGLSLGLEQS